MREAIRLLSASRLRPLRVGALAALLLVGLPSAPRAHEVPADVTVHAYLKPEDGRLRLLVRVPLEAVRDVEFPLRGPGYLDLERIGPELRDAARLWIAEYVDVYEEGRRLGEPRIVAARASLPSDRSFGSYHDALAHVTGPGLPADTELFWEQAMMDVLLAYPIRSEDARFAIRPELAHLGVRTTTVLRFVPPDGETRVFRYHGDPGRVELDPRWHQAALRFVESGFRHILNGLDHLLFLFCLVIPIRRLRPMVAIVTSFTVAHSITLLAAARGLAPGGLWFPPLIETLIALSIVYMAFENIVGAGLDRRWLMAFGFGLVHGFGFAFVLAETLQFAGAHLVTSLLAFNVGVELGQLSVLLLMVPALILLFRRIPERMGTILLSALVAHEAWHWMTERGSALLEHRVGLPALDAGFLAGLLRWLMLLVVAGGAAWGLFEVFGRWLEPGPERAQVGAGGEDWQGW